MNLNESCFSTILRVAFLSLMVLGTSSTNAQPIEKAVLHKAEPSNELINEVNTSRYRPACYDVFTGALDTCPFTLEIEGLAGPNDVVPVEPECDFRVDGTLEFNTCGHGGHKHPNEINRPLLYTPLGSNVPQSILFPADLNTDPRIVAAETTRILGGTTIAAAEFPASQASGVYTWLMKMQPSPRKQWFDLNVFSDGSVRTRGTFSVEVPNLRRLPDPGPGDLYIKARRPDTRHIDKDAYSMSEFGFRILPAVAAAIEFNQKGKKISINDISLPMGGLFDIRGLWSVNHKTHRTGDAMDLNLTPLTCNPLVYDPVMNAAVDSILKRFIKRDGSVRSAALCEGDHWHIDFTERL